ncbi:hypothetical protein SNEBB_000123 [Seison nebaliae]|nr:hypothetical protein SNEBB_000123 [Seison nebaliae]
MVKPKKDLMHFLLFPEELLKHLKTTSDTECWSLLLSFIYTLNISETKFRERTRNENINSINERDERIENIKVLILKISSYYNWSLLSFEENVPVAMINDLLLILFKVNDSCGTDDERMKREDKSIDQFSRLIFNQWKLRLCTKYYWPVHLDRLKIPLLINGLIDPTNNLAQANANVKDQVIKCELETLNLLKEVTLEESKIFCPNFNSFSSQFNEKYLMVEKELKAYSIDSFAALVYYDIGLYHLSRDQFEEASSRFVQCQMKLKQIFIEINKKGEEKQFFHTKTYLMKYCEDIDYYVKLLNCEYKENMSDENRNIQVRMMEVRQLIKLKKWKRIMRELFLDEKRKKRKMKFRESNPIEFFLKMLKEAIVDGSFLDMQKLKYFKEIFELMKKKDEQLTVIRIIHIMWRELHSQIRISHFKDNWKNLFNYQYLLILSGVKFTFDYHYKPSKLKLHGSHSDMVISEIYKKSIEMIMIDSIIPSQIIEKLFNNSLIIFDNGKFPLKYSICAFVLDIHLQTKLFAINHLNFQNLPPNCSWMKGVDLFSFELEVAYQSNKSIIPKNGILGNIYSSNLFIQFLYSSLLTSFVRRNDHQFFHYFKSLYLFLQRLQKVYKRAIMVTISNEKLTNRIDNIFPLALVLHKIIQLYSILNIRDWKSMTQALYYFVSIQRNVANMKSVDMKEISLDENIVNRFFCERTSKCYRRKFPVERIKLKRLRRQRSTKRKLEKMNMIQFVEDREKKSFKRKKRKSSYLANGKQIHHMKKMLQSDKKVKRIINQFIPINPTLTQDIDYRDIDQYHLDRDERLNVPPPSSEVMVTTNSQINMLETVFPSDEVPSDSQKITHPNKEEKQDLLDENDLPLKKKVFFDIYEKFTKPKRKRKECAKHLFPKLLDKKLSEIRLNRQFFFDEFPFSLSMVDHMKDKCRVNCLIYSIEERMFHEILKRFIRSKKYCLLIHSFIYQKDMKTLKEDDYFNTKKILNQQFHIPSFRRIICKLLCLFIITSRPIPHRMLHMDEVDEGKKIEETIKVKENEEEKEKIMMTTTESIGMDDVAREVTMTKEIITEEMIDESDDVKADIDKSSKILMELTTEDLSTTDETIIGPATIEETVEKLDEIKRSSIALARSLLFFLISLFCQKSVANIPKKLKNNSLTNLHEQLQRDFLKKENDLDTMEDFLQVVFPIICDWSSAKIDLLKILGNLYCLATGREEQFFRYSSISETLIKVVSRKYLSIKKILLGIEEILKDFFNSPSVHKMRMAIEVSKSIYAGQNSRKSSPSFRRESDFLLRSPTFSYLLSICLLKMNKFYVMMDNRIILYNLYEIALQRQLHHQAVAISQFLEDSSFHLNFSLDLLLDDSVRTNDLAEDWVDIYFDMDLIEHIIHDYRKKGRLDKIKMYEKLFGFTQNTFDKQMKMKLLRTNYQMYLCIQRLFAINCIKQDFSDIIL